MLANEINTQTAFNGAVTPRTVFGLQDLKSRERQRAIDRGTPFVSEVVTRWKKMLLSCINI